MAKMDIFKFKKTEKKVKTEKTEKKEKLAKKHRTIHNKKKIKFLRLNIRIKLMGSYLLLVMFIILVGALSYQSASNAIIHSYQTSAQQTLDMQGEYLEYGFGTVKAAAVEFLVDKNLTSYLAGEFEIDKNQHTQYYSDEKSAVVTKADSNEFIKSIYFFADDVYSLSTNKKSALDMYTQYTSTDQGKLMLQDPEKYYWFGKNSIIDESLKVNSDDYAVRVVKTFYGKNAFLAIDVDKQIILDVLNKINSGKGGKVAFVTADGIEIESDGSRDSLFTETTFYKESVKSKETIGYKESVNFNGNDYMFLFRKVSDTGSMVCVLVPKETILKQVADIKYMALIVIIVATLLAILIGGGISLNLSRSMDYVIRKIKQVAEGDVSVRLDDKKRDEFGQLAVHMNVMLENITALLNHAKGVSGRITTSAAEVKESSSIFSESSLGISTAMYEIQEGLVKQADDTVSCVGNMEELANKIELVDEETNQIRKIADFTGQAIAESFDNLDLLREKSKETTHITEDAIISIRELQEKSNRIYNIINVIKEIADETELLSLNASIEAARAGEAGRGFSVVADEIKKLAAQSLNSTEEIKKIVKDIADTTEVVVEAVNAAGVVIYSQEETVTHTQQAFTAMKEQAEDLLEKVSSITQRVRQMQTEKENSVSNMENVSAVTEEVVASVITVNEKTQNQVVKVQNLTELSEVLMEQSKQLEQAMEKFTI